MNVLATQRLLEAAKEAPVLKRFVYASSSSVYGEAPAYPTKESDPTVPVSPYGVTKLAGEHLARLYAHNWELPTVSLRFFTVYGPRQRPDMAMNRFLSAVRDRRTLTLWGTGEQIRDFTFVSDIVDANIAAAFTPDVAPGSFYNVAGGSSMSVNELLRLIEGVTSLAPIIERNDPQPGDVQQTGGSIELIKADLGWTPTISTLEGVRAQWEWHQGQPRQDA
jgi:nucleoside-diphosphate-sugar epimerase